MTLVNVKMKVEGPGGGGDGGEMKWGRWTHLESEVRRGGKKGEAGAGLSRPASSSDESRDSSSSLIRS